MLIESPKLPYVKSRYLKRTISDQEPLQDYGFTLLQNLSEF